MHTDSHVLPTVRGAAAAGAVVGVSRNGVYRLLQNDPTFPKPMYLGPATVVWDRAELIAWRDSKRAA